MNISDVLHGISMSPATVLRGGGGIFWLLPKPMLPQVCERPPPCVRGSAPCRWNRLAGGPGGPRSAGCSRAAVPGGLALRKGLLLRVLSDPVWVCHFTSFTTFSSVFKNIFVLDSEESCVYSGPYSRKYFYVLTFERKKLYKKSVCQNLPIHTLWSFVFLPPLGPTTPSL